MSNIRPFQIILIGIFASFAIFGLIFFAFYKGGGSSSVNAYGPKVEIWGTQDSKAFQSLFVDISKDDKNFQVVSYRQLQPETFDDELVNAIAEGRSPDLVVLPHDTLVKHRAKLLAITTETLPECTFLDTYVDGAEVFMLTDGTYALPFAVDPMVMYWNRDIFSSSGLASPPTTWEKLVSETTPAITRVTQTRDIERSAVAFGEYTNINHAKEIMGMLFLQAGTDVVTETDRGYRVDLLQSDGKSLRAADAALSFYTQFAIPSRVEYSWSRSLPNNKLEFTGGDVGMYFGFGSELTSIRNANPNLNFDMARVPQGASATALRGYGTFYGFAIPKASTNTQGAYRVALVLGSHANAARLTELLSLAPVHRTTIANGSSDPYRQVLFSSALVARGWLDPNPQSSENVFKQMIEDVTSGRVRVSQAISDAAGRLRLLF